MLFVFNKNKIVSYSISLFIVVIIFAFSTSLIPKSDIKMIPISSNITNSIKNENYYNNIK